MTNQAPSKYVLVVGHGRSGTNMVLDLLDCHRNTFCRNEPNEVYQSALNGLGDNMFPHDVPADFDARWTQAVTTTARSNGERDRFGTDKDYFRSSLHARIGQGMMSREKIRQFFIPRVDGKLTEEWPCPPFYYDKAAQAQALPVLKILLSPAWITRAHASQDAQHVVHVQRRPTGFVQSWWGRYVTGIGGGPENVFADNQPSLVHILDHFGRSADMPTEYSLFNLVVSELWRWRYMNEVLIAQLSDAPRYMRFGYEELMGDKETGAQALYDFVGLELTTDVRQSIEGMQNTLFKARKPDGVDPKLVEDAVEFVLQDSAYKDALLNR